MLKDQDGSRVMGVRTGALLIFTAIGVATTAFLATRAQAQTIANKPMPTRTVGAFSGRLLDNTPFSCYSETAGGVRGTGAAGCAGVPWPSSPRWEVQLPNDDASSTLDAFDLAVTFVAKGNGSSGPACQAYSINKTSGIVTTSQWKPQVSAQYAITAVNLSTVPAGGYLFLACDTLTSASFAVGSVSWGSCGGQCSTSCSVCNDGRCECPFMDCTNVLTPFCVSNPQVLCSGHGGVNTSLGCSVSP
jgi:hypothetical protein